MKARRDVALAVVVWVVVVVVCASLVWAVISRAGRGVAGGDDPLPAAERSAPAASDSAGTPTRSPSRSPSGSSSSSSSSPSSSDPSSGPGSPAVTVRRSWQGRAGVVFAECRGTAIRLTGASPTSGYAAEVDDSGPDRVRVEFESEDGDRRTWVEAECRAGVPAFTEDRQGED